MHLLYDKLVHLLQRLKDYILFTKWENIEKKSNNVFFFVKISYFLQSKKRCNTIYNSTSYQNTQAL